MTWSLVDESRSKVKEGDDDGNDDFGLHMVSLTCCIVNNGDNRCPLHLISICFHSLQPSNKPERVKITW